MSYSQIVSTFLYTEGVRNHLNSTRKNIPCYDDKLYICFRRSDGSEFRRPFYEIDKKKYPGAWKDWQSGTRAAKIGTSLNEMSGITPGEIKTLEELSIDSIEELSAVAKQRLLPLGERFLLLRTVAQNWMHKRDELKKLIAEEERKQSEEIKRIQEVAEQHGGVENLSEENLQRLAQGEELELDGLDSDLSLELEHEPQEIRIGAQELNPVRYSGEAEDPLNHITTEDAFGD